MVRYIVKRILYMIPVTIALSFVCFLVVDLAPGDFISVYEAAVRNNREMTAEQQRLQLEYLDTMRSLYGLDKPLIARYSTWMWRIVTKGDFGYSFQVMRPVSTLIVEKLGWTILVSALGLVMGITVTFALGVYTATHQFSAVDYATNVVAFLGMATPGFFLALLLMAFAVFVLRWQVGGLFSAQYVAAPWSWSKFVDLLKHLSIPLGVGLITGSGGGIRVIRGNLLDKLSQPYVQTARAKGLPERTVIYRHALRNALHPWVMGMGGVFSDMISGDTMLSIVLGLPTVGFVFYTALMQQDSYVAGTFLLITSMLLQGGNLLADLALVWLDPTIRYE